METPTRKRSNILNVRTLEEEIYLIQEWDRDYNQNWWMDAKEAYIKGLEFIDNLKL